MPPVRDEESETQRKAHAKRVRETRRSTQGVTLEDLKSAEQLVKKKQQEENKQRTSELQQLVASQQQTLQQQKSSPTNVPSVSIQQPSSGNSSSEAFSLIVNPIFMNCLLCRIILGHVFHNCRAHVSLHSGCGRSSDLRVDLVVSF